jgi:ketosteroid isomerase-like protein
MRAAEQPIETHRHLDLVRQVFARLEALDPHAAAGLCHEDFELHWTGLGSREHSHQGREAFEHHLGELSHGWDEIHVKCDRVARSAGDRVLALYHLLGHAPDGETAQSPHAAVVRLRDDQVWRWDAFQDAAHSFDWLAAESRLA